MKTIISSIASLVALSALVSAAPLQPVERSANGPIVWSQVAEFYQVISQAQPTTNQEHIYGFSTAVISRTQDSNEFDTIVSFPMPALSEIANATSSSTCNFVIKNPGHVTGSQNIELFTIGKEISLNDSITWSTQPFTNEL